MDRKAGRILQAALLSLVLAVSAQLLGERGGSATAADKSSKEAGLSKRDADFLADMARADLAEISAGKLAQSKAASEEVRKFGQHMVDEHGKMLAAGGKLAKARGIEPPSSPDKKHQNALKKLEGMSGTQFDQAYMEQMVEDHQDALRLVRNVASKADDAELKALASGAVPHVEKHLAQAQQLAKSKAGGKK